MIAGMSRLKNFISRPFAAGLAGGLVVGVLGLARDRYRAGSQGNSTTTTTTVASAGSPALHTEAAAASALTAGDDLQPRRRLRRLHRGAAEADTPSSSPFKPVPQQGGTATGSGFLIDNDGHILTNAHVVDGASSVTVSLARTASTLDAKVVGDDNSTDVAVLEVDPSKVNAQPLVLRRLRPRSTSAMRSIAIGNPFGLDRTVTSGIVSALQRQISAPDGFRSRT